MLDPDDDVACVRAMTGLHEPGAGRVVCHSTPGATWPVLVRDLLQALGKRRDALARARRVRDGAALVRVWLRAEDIRHLVVLRAHLLRPALLAALAELAAADGLIVWLVWHHTDVSPPGSAHGVWPSWRCAVKAIRGHRSSVMTLVLERDELAYRDVLARPGARPGCGGSILPGNAVSPSPHARSARFCSD